MKISNIHGLLFTVNPSIILGTIGFIVLLAIAFFIATIEGDL